MKFYILYMRSCDTLIIEYKKKNLFIQHNNKSIFLQHTIKVGLNRSFDPANIDHLIFCP